MKRVGSRYNYNPIKHGALLRSDDGFYSEQNRALLPYKFFNVYISTFTHEGKQRGTAGQGI